MQSKYIGLILGFLVLVVLSSGCISINGLLQDSMNNSNNQTSNTYSNYGVSFNYPDNWTLYHEHEDDGSDVIIVQKNDSINSPQFQVQIMSNPFGMSDQDAINAMQDNSTPEGGREISNNTLTIDSNTAYESTFTINNLDQFTTTMKMQQIFFVSNGKTYILNFQAPNKDFDKEKPNFDLILNSLKVQ